MLLLDLSREAEMMILNEMKGRFDILMPFDQKEDGRSSLPGILGTS